MQWRKSSYSHLGGIDQGNCVETAVCTCTNSEVLIRDSKNPDGPRLVLSTAAFRSLMAQLK